MPGTGLGSRRTSGRLVAVQLLRLLNVKCHLHHESANVCVYLCHVSRQRLAQLGELHIGCSPDVCGPSRLAKPVGSYVARNKSPTNNLVD